jgi:ParB family chromosome partitioning protein
MGNASDFGAVSKNTFYYFDPKSLLVVDDVKHPLYDERVNLPLDEHLVKSIMVKGVVEPVIVRLNGKDKKGVPIVEVIDGRQRVRAAREANNRLEKEGKEPVRVPGVNRRGEDADLFGVMVSANEIRQSDGPLTRAKKIQKYISMGRTEDEAAITFGCSSATIKNLLGLLDLHPQVQAKISSGEIPVMVADKLRKLPQDEQPAKLQELIDAGLTKGAAGVEAAKKAARGEKPASAKVRMASCKTVAKWQVAMAEACLEYSETDKDILEFGRDLLAYLLGDADALPKKHWFLGLIAPKVKEPKVKAEKKAKKEKL